MSGSREDLRVGFKPKYRRHPLQMALDVTGLDESPRARM